MNFSIATVLLSTLIATGDSRKINGGLRKKMNKGRPGLGPKGKLGRHYFDAERYLPFAPTACNDLYVAAAVPANAAICAACHAECGRNYDVCVEGAGADQAALDQCIWYEMDATILACVAKYPIFYNAARCTQLALA
eukprot:1008881_1